MDYAAKAAQGRRTPYWLRLGSVRERGFVRIGEAERGNVVLGWARLHPNPHPFKGKKGAAPNYRRGTEMALEGRIC
jgi:hypothetical protein